MQSQREAQKPSQTVAACILPAVSSAILLILSFPRPGIFILGWVSLFPLYAVIARGTLKRALCAGLITGILFNTVYLFWVKEYKHPASLPGVLLVEVALFLVAVVLGFILYHHSCLRRAGAFREIAFPLAWIAVDYLKTVGYLAFPWGIIGYSQYRNLAMIQSASIFGVWGISFLVYYFNAVLAGAVIDLKLGRGVGRIAASAAVVFVLMVGSFVFGLFTLSSKNPVGTRRVALIQPNFDPWSPDIEGNLLKEIDLTEKALSEKPDLIVWSESSIPFLYDFYLSRNFRYARLVHDYLTSIKKPVLLGTTEFIGEYENGEFSGDFYNVAVFYAPQGGREMYRKIHLVPFGEWFPYKRLFPWVVRILEAAGAGDFKPGTEYTVFTCNGMEFNALICYEDVFGDLARKFVTQGSRLLVNITNDAWTASPTFELQHFSISVFRSIENRVSLVRCANGGVTACVDPCGRIIGSLPVFTTDFLICDVPVSSNERITVYSRFGDLFPRFIAAWVFVLLLLQAVKKAIDTIGNKNNM
ncbi:MAG: apolipoprotein N-acyltransferase [Spirochaetes bacterium]|nr:apolipoprotein N-acyltransferase [Spirochaetota bacterium]